jgi:hypothetical protein
VVVDKNPVLSPLLEPITTSTVSVYLEQPAGRPARWCEPLIRMDFSRSSESTTDSLALFEEKLHVRSEHLVCREITWKQVGEAISLPERLNEEVEISNANALRALIAKARQDKHFANLTQKLNLDD